MKVGSLFAEIGFKVNESGLQKFSKAMDAFHKKISDGLKDMRSYAKAARDISQAMRDVYTPSRSEAKARYNAETQRMLIQTKLAAVRAKKFEQDSNTRALNAASRAKQIELKEKGVSGGRSGSRTDAIIRSLAMFSRNTIFTSLGGVIGALFSPMGSVIGAHIGKMIDKVIGAIFRAASWLGRTIISGMQFGMAYRDYRNFTGRSTSSLGGLMARTFNTSNMSPEDVLKDAARLESDYWGMILGQGNPALWQLLGVSPTGSGEVDLQNLIGRIGGVTGGFQNRGLARYLFKMAGLDEEYLNMMLDESNGDVDVNDLLQQSEQWEQINRELRTFEFEVKKIKGELASLFVDSGLLQVIKQALKDLATNLPAIVQMFKDLFNIVSHFIGWLKLEFPSLFGDKRPGYQHAYDRYNNAMAEGQNPYWFAFKDIIMHPKDFIDVLEKSAYGQTYDEMINSKTNVNNNFYLNNPEEMGRAYGSVMRETQEITNRNGQPMRQQLNAAYETVK